MVVAFALGFRACVFYRGWSRLRVIAFKSDWLISMFASTVIGLSLFWFYGTQSKVLYWMRNRTLSNLTYTIYFYHYLFSETAICTFSSLLALVLSFTYLLLSVMSS